MKTTGFKIALAVLAFSVGAGLGQVHKHLRTVMRPEARMARAQSDKDAKDAQACLDRGGMPIYPIAGSRLAGCYVKK